MGNMSVKGPLVVNQTTTIQKTAANLSSYAKSKPNGAKFLVVGLGNYSMAGTRHSVGMAVLNRFCNATGSRWAKDRHCQGDVATTTVHENIKLILLKPRLMMNINGVCVAKAVDKFGIMPENLYLVHDDLDRNFGKFSIKKAGSAGGHNGVKSVISSLKSDQMPRLRIGIGRPVSSGSVVSFVLGRFTCEEKEQLPKIMDSAIEVLQTSIKKRAAGLGS